MRVWTIVAAMAALAACAPKPAATNAAAPVTLAQANGGNAASACTAAALTPGTQACNDYLAAIGPSGGAGNEIDMNANATDMRAQIRAQADAQRAQMQQQMNQATQNGQDSSAGCKTSRDANNNVTTVCP